VSTALSCAFDRPLRRAVAALWAAGSAICAVTAVVALVRIGGPPALALALPAVGLCALAAGTSRGARWALAVSFVLLGLQLVGAAGSAWELGHVQADDKSDWLRALGVDPTLGVALDLAYSTVASAVFAWAAVRLLTRGRQPRSG